MIGEILPARAHIDARQFEAGQKRYRTDLILRIVLRDSPAVPIIEFERLRFSPLSQVEKRQVPPNMRDHEGVQINPGILCLLQKSRAVVDLTAGQQHVSERVLRPGLLAAHRERGARRRLRLIERGTVHRRRQPCRARMEPVRWPEQSSQRAAWQARHRLNRNTAFPRSLDPGEFVRQLIANANGRPRSSTQARSILALSCSRGVAEVPCFPRRREGRRTRPCLGPRAASITSRLDVTTRLGICSGGPVFAPRVSHTPGFDEIIDAAQRGVDWPVTGLPR